MSQRSWVYINWLCTHFDAIDFIILCSYSIIFVSFRVSNETMAGCTWNPNIVHQNKVNWFGHDQDLIYPWVERIKWSNIWQFGLTFLFWVILLICSVLECVRVPYLHMLGILEIRYKYNEGNNIIEFFISLSWFHKEHNTQRFVTCVNDHAFKHVLNPVLWCPKIRLDLSIRVYQSIVRCIVYYTTFIFLRFIWQGSFRCLV